MGKSIQEKARQERNCEAVRQTDKRKWVCPCGNSTFELLIGGFIKCCDCENVAIKRWTWIDYGPHYDGGKDGGEWV